MKRKMMLCERIMYVDRATPFTLVQAARIRGRLDPAQLRHALDRIQLKHPMLRCAVLDGDSPQIVLEDDPAPIPLRLVVRESDQDWLREAHSERETAFASDQAPLMRAVWIHDEDGGELLLTCHHCICDGLSMVTLLRETLALCDRPDLDIGHHTSVNGMEDLLPEEVLNDRRAHRNARWKAMAFRLFFAVRRKRTPVPQGEFYVLRWKLPSEASQALAERARAEGVTVFAAIAVAFSLAFRTIRSDRANGKVFVPVDIRKFLPRLGADSLFASAPGAIVALDNRTPPDQVDELGYWNQARAFKTRLNQRIERLTRNVYEFFIGLELLHSVFDQFIAERRSDLDAYDVTLSNVGRIEMPRDYHGFHLETVYSPSLHLPWRTTTSVLMSGFAGELDFSFMSDQHSLPREQAEAIRDHVIASLWERGRTANPAETDILSVREAA
ncbi:condensation domain-containing protein [Lysobacter antibioticus]|uniref:Condensation domain protein n=1 Tax=Lysobacter antibioticus TaxID=84531 RepID=A0A0S2FGA2_LYSAN|nr:condensation domain-containing protein [Lysobacter antibioticus]ALN82559.1 condensation domain protein [Lysobacter antibioticus]